MAFKPEAKKLSSDAVIKERLKGYKENKIGTVDPSSRSLPEPSIMGDRRGSKSKSELSHISQSTGEESMAPPETYTIPEE